MTLVSCKTFWLQGRRAARMGSDLNFFVLNHYNISSDSVNLVKVIWLHEFHISRCCLTLNKAKELNLKSDTHPPKNFFIISFNDSSSKLMKNGFYFILKALFVLKIWKFLSWFFVHVKKRLDWKEDYVVTACNKLLQYTHYSTSHELMATRQWNLVI